MTKNIIQFAFEFHILTLILSEHSGAVQVIEDDCVLNADIFSHWQKITF